MQMIRRQNYILERNKYNQYRISNTKEGDNGMDIEKICAVLVKLLERQEGVKITYTLEKKESEEKTA